MFLRWPGATECCRLWAAQLKETREQKDVPCHHERGTLEQSLSYCRWQARVTMQVESQSKAHATLTEEKLPKS